jgi:O-methyltransferase involved in polyketide biosynthesis
MTSTARGFTPVQETAFLTLKGRALDSASERPILDDPLASATMAKVDHDFDAIKVMTATQLQIAVRAKGLDRAVQRCIAEQPDAVVLDLGAGLDTRVFRIIPPPTVDWFDVDYPELTELRQRVVPARPHAHVIGASVNEPHWLDVVPGHRHAIIVAEALLPFLSHNEILSLVRRLIEHFPSGDLIFNGYPASAQRLAKRAPALKGVVAIERSEAFTDPHVPESWHPQLKLVEEVLLARDPESARDVDKFPFLMRMMTRPFALTAGLARFGARVLHYRF